MSRRVLVLVFLSIGVVALAALLVGGSVAPPPAQAGPPPPVLSLDVLSVREAGRDLSLIERAVAGSRLVEVRATDERSALRPLAVAPDGSALALTGPSGAAGPLVVAHADGSQLEIALDGVRGAAFDPTGAWVAAVDGAGSLWWVDAGTGQAQRLHDGPLAADLSFSARSEVLAIRLSSLDAPVWAAAVLVDPSTGAETVLVPASEPGQLVYAAAALTDGSFAIVRHLTGGGVTVERSLASGDLETLIARLGTPGVTVASDGGWVAWVASGRATLAPVAQPGATRDLGAAEAVRFAPDSPLLMTFSDDGSRVFTPDGTPLLEAAAPLCWLGDGRGCRP